MRPANIKAVPAAQPHVAGDLAVARRVLDSASDAIKSLGGALNGQFTHAVDTIMAVKGRVIVSGMGKSGLIGRKIAATLASTGTPAYFVHPAEASHGDLGGVTRQDALLILSWRGESAELSDLITHAKRFHIPLIGMASNPGSTLLKAADVALVLPEVREACPMGLAPTTSTTTMLVLGDALAVALMERRGFSVDQYRDFHPGGSLGRALIRVMDLMHGSDEVPLVEEGASMRQALTAMEKHRFGCVGLTDKKGALVGIITDGDLRRNWDRDLRNAKASEVMTRAPKVARSDQLAAEAIAFMNEKKITQLFVLDPKDKSKKPVGILHIHDCLRAGLR
ncbi:MAG: KpsF/GutQ family sugar-phosphate isomerase [Rhizomicrobium sp.]